MMRVIYVFALCIVLTSATFPFISNVLPFIFSSHIISNKTVVTVTPSTQTPSSHTIRLPKNIDTPLLSTKVQNPQTTKKPKRKKKSNTENHTSKSVDQTPSSDSDNLASFSSVNSNRISRMSRVEAEGDAVVPPPLSNILIPPEKSFMVRKPRVENDENIQPGDQKFYEYNWDEGLEGLDHLTPPYGHEQELENSIRKKKSVQVIYVNPSDHAHAHAHAHDHLAPYWPWPDRDRDHDHEPKTVIYIYGGNGRRTPTSPYDHSGYYYPRPTRRPPGGYLYPKPKPPVYLPPPLNNTYLPPATTTMAPETTTMPDEGEDQIDPGSYTTTETPTTTTVTTTTTTTTTPAVTYIPPPTTTTESEQEILPGGYTTAEPPSVTYLPPVKPRKDIKLVPAGSAEVNKPKKTIEPPKETEGYVEPQLSNQYLPLLPPVVNGYGYPNKYGHGHSTHTNTHGKPYGPQPWEWGHQNQNHNEDYYEYSDEYEYDGSESGSNSYEAENDYHTVSEWGSPVPSGRFQPYREDEGWKRGFIRSRQLKNDDRLNRRRQEYLPENREKWKGRGRRGRQRRSKRKYRNENRANAKRMRNEYREDDSADDVNNGDEESRSSQSHGPYDDEVDDDPYNLDEIENGANVELRKKEYDNIENSHNNHRNEIITQEQDRIQNDDPNQEIHRDHPEYNNNFEYEDEQEPNEYKYKLNKYSHNNYHDDNNKARVPNFETTSGKFRNHYKPQEYIQPPIRDEYKEKHSVRVREPYESRNTNEAISSDNEFKKFETQGHLHNPHYKPPVSSFHKVYENSPPKNKYVNDFQPEAQELRIWNHGNTVPLNYKSHYNGSKTYNKATVTETIPVFPVVPTFKLNFPHTVISPYVKNTEYNNDLFGGSFSVPSTTPSVQTSHYLHGLIHPNPLYPLQYNENDLGNGNSAGNVVVQPDQLFK